MGIKQITWIINDANFVHDTPRRRKLLTQSTSHLFSGKLLKYIVEIKLVARGGKHENNECHTTRLGTRPPNRRFSARGLWTWWKSSESPVSVKHREKEKQIYPYRRSIWGLWVNSLFAPDAVFPVMLWREMRSCRNLWRSSPKNSYYASVTVNRTKRPTRVSGAAC